MLKVSLLAAMQFFAVTVKGKIDLMKVCACMYGLTYSKSKDQPGKAANPARGQLDRENEYFPVPVRA